MTPLQPANQPSRAVSLKSKNGVGVQTAIPRKSARLTKPGNQDAARVVKVAGQRGYATAIERGERKLAQARFELREGTKLFARPKTFQRV